MPGNLEMLTARPGVRNQEVGDDDGTKTAVSGDKEEANGGGVREKGEAEGRGSEATRAGRLRSPDG